MPVYRILKGSIHEQWLKSRAKVQIFGGGFGNGKTSALCVKVQMIAKDYPGVVGIVARSTLTALHDTTLLEFMKWCPRTWLDPATLERPTGSYERPHVMFKNHSNVLFRYIKQKGKGTGGSTTSSLLSGNYGFIAVDQFDDPEFTEKDFYDMLGRLRSQDAKYVGDDNTMPLSGPRWLLLTLNPVRNWFYHKIVKNVIAYKQSGIITPKFQEMIDRFREATGDHDLSIDQLFDLVEGPTEANAMNLPKDYIASLRMTYSGPMASRFIDGGWQAYEGLVYPDFQPEVHMVPEDKIKSYLDFTKSQYTKKPIEGYDHGLMHSPSVYLFGWKLLFPGGDTLIIFCDGFYKKTQSIEELTNDILTIRKKWGADTNKLQTIFADPAIFRKTGANLQTIGPSVADLFWNGGKGVMMVRGQNDITAGIAKCSSYLKIDSNMQNPFTGAMGSPRIFFNQDKLEFFEEEIGDYIFKQNTIDPDSGTDKPRDAKDHAMDAWKYAMTTTPKRRIDSTRQSKPLNIPMKWMEHAS